MNINKFTPIHNSILDEWLPKLNGNSIRILVFMARWTFEGARQFSYQELTSQIGISSQSARDSINELLENKLIEKCGNLSPFEAKNFLCSAKQRQMFVDSNTFSVHCGWCGCQTAILHAHHFPITARDGGKITVNICPNCHAEFHSLVDGTKFRLAQGLVHHE